MADLNAALAKFDDELSDQILLMTEGLKKDQGRLAEIEKKAQQLDIGKVKPGIHESGPWPRTAGPSGDG